MVTEGSCLLWNGKRRVTERAQLKLSDISGCLINYASTLRGRFRAMTKENNVERV